MKKIKLNLFDLKSKKDLISIYEFFRKSTSNWFDKDGNCKQDYFEITACPLCSKADSIHQFTIDNFNYEKCTGCGSIYTNPYLKEGVLTGLYNNGDYKAYQKNLVAKGSEVRSSILENRKFIQVKEILNKKNASLLDVGCGNATFLNVCKQSGWNVQGVDPTKSSAQNALEKYNIEVHEGEFGNAKINSKFDVVTFWGVLEHLRYPVLALERARSMLNDGGMIVFEVPSSDCFLSKYLSSYPFEATRYIESGRHNIFFSENIINCLAVDIGMEVAFIESNGLDIQTIFMEEFSVEITEKILKIQDVLNNEMNADHYRVFLKIPA
jgi:2-polyprenyl-3-methyl-5-hydroxy-6-metoxy-1,4-benzoquinol methylase